MALTTLTEKELPPRGPAERVEVGLTRWVLEI